MRRFARLRGVLALGTLLMLAASNAEAVFGDIHDGDEHHESMVDALMDHVLQGAGPVHVADWDMASTLQRPADQHPAHHHRVPGGYDHCSHVHAVGIPTGFAVEFPTTVAEAHILTQKKLLGTRLSIPPHPPKA